MVDLASSPTPTPRGDGTARKPAATTPPRHTNRPEIQGLRTVAVLLVVLYHLWPGRLRGGYIGVDVFFVISGFLITGNLLREVDRRGRVRFADFWARRARRLLPAAFLVLVATGIGILLWVPQLVWQQFFKEIAASGLYVENWSLARDAVDYLASSNAPSPVQHYWTLSAEEQFYLGWPFLVMLGVLIASRTSWRRTHAITAVLGAAALASLAFSLWQTGANPSVAYFSTFTRAWEFAAGALLACAGARVTLRGRPAALLSLAGLGTIAACGLLFTHDTPMPGTAAVMVVLASAAVIAAGHPDVTWSPSRLLVWRPATFIGDISYSIYLWHWPLLVLAPYALAHSPGFLGRVLILVATVLLAWATKLLVEDPVRTTGRLGLPRPGVALGATGLAAALLVGACAALWWDVEQGNRQAEATARSLVEDAPPCFGAAARDPRATDCPNPALEDSLVPSATGAVDDYPSYPGCEEQMTKRPLAPCQFGDVNDPSVPHVAVIGDSHARALMPALIELAKKRVLSLDLFTSGGCVWGVGRPNIVDKQLRDACTSLKDDLQPLLLRTAREYDFIITTGWTNKTSPPIDDAAAALAEAWKPVAAMGVPIVALRDNPAPGASAVDNPNTCLAGVPLDEANQSCGLNRRRTLDRYPDPWREAARATTGARYLDLSRFYCDRTRCPVVVGGVDVYRDNSHVTVTYARTMAPFYYRALVTAGVLDRR